VDAELEVLREGLVELGVLVLVLRELREEVEALLRHVLLDDLEDLVLLERLARDVEREVLGVDDALDEGELLGHELLAVVHDEDAADVELDVVRLLAAALEEVEGRALRDEDDRLELERALDGEVLPAERVVPVRREGLVEGVLLLLLDLLGDAHPDGLRLVEELRLLRHLLDLLRLLLVLVLDVLDLAVLLLLLLLLVLLDLALRRLLDLELDGLADELRVLLDEVLDAALLDELELVLLEVEDDARAALEARRLRVRRDGEGAARRRLPALLLVVIVLRVDDHLVRDEVGRVEADAELADHRDVRAGRERLHEGLRARLGDRAEVVDEVGLGHTDARVLERERVVRLVCGDRDLELRLRRELRGVREALLADLVERLPSEATTIEEQYRSRKLGRNE
jgi:hypothetical protein